MKTNDATARSWRVGKAVYHGPLDPRTVYAVNIYGPHPEIDGEAYLVATVYGATSDEAGARARDAVRAVNAHEAMREALREALDQISADHQTLTSGAWANPAVAELAAQIGAALALAEGDA